MYSLKLTAHCILATAILLAGVMPIPASDRDCLDTSLSDALPVSIADTSAEAVLYYFHRTTRCQACLDIEAYIDESLRAHFGDALETGRLLWRPTNIEMPEGRHFEEDFSLTFNSAILVRLDGGKIASWINLEKVWDLLENKKEFVRYIKDQVGSVLEPDGGVAGTGTLPTD